MRSRLASDRSPEPLAHLLPGALLLAGVVIADAPGRRVEMGEAMGILVDSLFESR